MSYLFVCKYNNLGGNLKRQVVSLTFRGPHEPGFYFSGMLFRLSQSYDRNQFDVVICIEEGRVLGWALVDNKKQDIMIYVRKASRQSGVGTKIMKRANRVYGQYRVHPWDSVSTDFFKSVGYEVRSER